MTTSVPTIAFDYRPSRWLLLALACAIVPVACAVLLCAATWPWRMLLILASAAWLGWSAWRLHQPPWRRLVWYGEGHWRLFAADGQPHIAELLTHRRIGALLVLRFRLHARQAFIAVLLPDNLGREDRRRLCVRLARLGAAGADPVTR